ncbi:MAG TPA: WhiB family transcriptional regulator [Acidimicrobiia bacterium]|nr:WhiB family transcriptional regulator [Acidimicrobiia bacterium]
MVHVDRVTPLDDAVRDVVDIDLLRPRWMRNAACRGEGFNAWFPSEEFGEDADAARRVCCGCRVRTDCLDYALAAGIRHGVWGGLSARERAAMAGATRRATANTPGRRTAGGAG